MDNCPIFIESYEAKVHSRLCVLLTFFSLAQTSVYSNIIFCEVSWGWSNLDIPTVTWFTDSVEYSRHLMLLSYLCWEHSRDASSPLHSASRHLSLHPFFHPLPQTQTGDELLHFPSALSTTVGLTFLLILLNPFSLSSTFTLFWVTALLFCLPHEKAPSALEINKMNNKPWLNGCISTLPCSSPSFLCQTSRLHPLLPFSYYPSTLI